MNNIDKPDNALQRFRRMQKMLAAYRKREVKMVLYPTRGRWELFKSGSQR